MIVSSDKVMVHDNSIFIHKCWMPVWLCNVIKKMNQIATILATDENLNDGSTTY